MLKKLILPLAFLLSIAGIAVGNEWYTHGGYPATGSTGSSAGLRAELDSITAGFDKLPSLTTNANKAVIVNSGATALTVTTGTISLGGDLSLSGNFSTTGAFNTSFTQGATTTLTLPLVNGTLATLAGTETFTTKTFDLSNNTLAGTTAQFNTALSDNDFATLAGAESLSNKTIVAPVLSGSATGTYTLAGTPTVTAPTISAPTFSGTASGSLTSLAVTNGVFTTSTVAADPVVDLGIASKQYVDAKSGQVNPIINGSFDVWQRGTSFAAANGIYTADRWKYNRGDASTSTVSRSTNVPSVAQAGLLFNYSLEVDVTTADASISATDNAGIQYRVEGYDFRQLAQRDIMVSFWVSSTKTGVYSLGLSNSGSNRTYVAEYTVALADTWEYKTVTVPASPSAGTWDYTTGIGLVMYWVLDAGSNHYNTVGSWQSNALMASANQVNAMDSNSNFFRITGVKLELGSVATPIQFVPFETELARAKRYYQKSFNYSVTPATNTGGSNGEFQWFAPLAGAVSMNSPSISLVPPIRTNAGAVGTVYNPNAADSQIRNATDASSFTSSQVIFLGESNLYFSGTGTAGTAVGETLRAHWTVDSEL